jgi:hypothetical protein
MWIISENLLHIVVWPDTWHDKTSAVILVIINIVIHVCESVVFLSGTNCQFFFTYLIICIAVGDSTNK